jgi:hypothetical protein
MEGGGWFMVLDECCAEINHYNHMTMEELAKKGCRRLAGRDLAYAAGAALLVVVRLALYSGKLYQLEEGLPAGGGAANASGTGKDDPREKRRGDLFILIRQSSYYFLGAWICVVAGAGYLMLVDGRIHDYAANTMVAYGCAVGAVGNEVRIMLRARRQNKIWRKQ